ncbi:MAG: DnaJ domain-containing protein [Lachnospiraceae bacterium]|nr:DnaJ domain-containing protein [Lachnospiraceae bacterium]
MADPYKVLGVNESCTDTELKKAYRDLSKKWHPDQNPNNAAEAEERFKEIQEAYRQIVDARERGTSAYGNSWQGSYGGGSGAYGNSQGAYGGRGYANYGYGSFNDYFNQWQQYSSGRRTENARTESNEEQAARNYINSGYYREALNALEGVEGTRRGARWYYYAAMAQQGMGNNVTALEYAKRAADMEPDNMMYSSFMQQLSSGGTWYQRQNANYGFGGFGGSGTSRWCFSMIMMNLCCSMMGGGIFWC